MQRLIGLAFAGIAFAALGLFHKAEAHEFWIDPVTFTPKVGASVPIVFRIGQDFAGDTYPFVRALSRRFTIVDGAGERALRALDGDDPATEIRFPRPGVAIVVHQRVAELITFDTFAAFEESAVYEGVERAVAEHRAANKPMTKIRELFTRCAKSLVNVGGGQAGGDRAIGLPLELVAEQNPYASTTAASLTVRLLHDGKPLAGALVKTWRQMEGAKPRLARSDAEGRVTVDVASKGEYLISAVHMIAPAAGEDADWSSLWATLTFKR